MIKVGHGYDVHKLVESRNLILGGVNIPHNLGLLGHSDADVLTHAIMDSLIGALCLGDIGKLFPDTDNKYKGISSLVLLESVYKTMSQRGYEVGNIDCTIIAQKPKLLPYIEEMRINISNILKMPKDSLNIKATTEEELGFTGSELGISAHSVCILYKRGV